MAAGAQRSCGIGVFTVTQEPRRRRLSADRVHSRARRDTESEQPEQLQQPDLSQRRELLDQASSVPVQMRQVWFRTELWGWQRVEQPWRVGRRTGDRSGGPWRRVRWIRRKFGGFGRRRKRAASRLCGHRARGRGANCAQDRPGDRADAQPGGRHPGVERGPDFRSARRRHRKFRWLPHRRSRTTQSLLTPLPRRGVQGAGRLPTACAWSP